MCASYERKLFLNLLKVICAHDMRYMLKKFLVVLYIFNIFIFIYIYLIYIHGIVIIIFF